MKKAFCLGAALSAVSIALYAQPVLHLKTRTIDATNGGELRQTSAPRLDLTRSHAVLQFVAHPGPDELYALAARGIRVLGYIPENGLVVSIPHGSQPGVDGLKWAGRLDAEDKISPLLIRGKAALSGKGTFVAEFYSDVDPGDAREIALRSGFEIRENPDLLRSHVLVYGPRANLPILAAWDEVDWIFPASDALTRGERTRPCAGGLTSSGPVPQSVPVIGGWNGSSIESLSLNYWFRSVTEKLPADSTESEIIRAWDEWTKYAQVSFTPAQADGPRTVTVLFASGNHGDGYPFDGPGGVLAHTFYPAPENPETIAGDSHFDDSESWQIGADTDVFSVALHEAGHALGLGHSDDPKAVMYPYYKRVSGLSADDIAAIQQVYTPIVTASTAPAGSPTTGGSQTPAQSGSTPAPAPTPTAPAPKQNAPPALQITSPPNTTISTSAATVTVSGTASSAIGLAGIAWTSSTGVSGMASGLQSWSTAPISLLVGTNALMITATDTAGNTSWRSLIVTRTQ